MISADALASNKETWGEQMNAMERSGQPALPSHIPLLMVSPSNYFECLGLNEPFDVLSSRRLSSTGSRDLILLVR